MLGLNPIPGCLVTSGVSGMNKAMMRRSRRRVRFDNPDQDFMFQWTLGCASLGGIEPGEAFEIAANIEDGDPESWVSAFEQAAIRFADAARRADLHRERTQGELWLKAFHARRNAHMLWRPSRPGFAANLAQTRDALAHASCRLGLPLRELTVETPAGQLPVMWADAGFTPAGLAIVFGGGDTIREDCWFFLGAGGVPRGWHVALVDTPGNSDSAARGVLATDRFDWMVPLTDGLAGRPEVDPARVAAVGFSGGGFLAMHAAAASPRIRACVGNSAIHDMAAILRQELPAALLHSPKPLQRMAMSIAGHANRIGAANVEKYLWQFGVEGMSEFTDMIGGHPVPLDQVDCPVLVMLAEGDAPSLHIQARDIVDQLSPRQPGTRLREFTAAEGADAHCQFFTMRLMHAEIFDWLEQQLPAKTGTTST